MWRFGILLAVASCGRFGFADLPAEVTPDALSPVIDAPPAPRLLACGSPARLTFAAAAHGVGAAGRDGGFDVFDVDSNGVLWGYSYTLGSDGTLSAVATHTQLGTSQSGQLGGA